MPMLGAVVAFLLGGIAIVAAKPWQVIQVAVYQSPTPTSTFTPTSTSTPTLTPTGTPTLTPTPEPPYVLHRILLGDTLESIAAQYGVTVEQIKALNSLSDDTILRGTDLKIPIAGGAEESSPTPTLTTSPTSLATTESSKKTYEVQSGDNLSEIAGAYGVTVEALKQANGLSSDTIVVGQTLIIPLGTPTPLPTSTPLPLPSPTPVPDFRYVSPTLLSPAKGRVYSGPAASLSILLNWVSVGLLDEDEWYLVSIYYSGGPQALPVLTQLTKLTSFRVPLELRPAKDAPSHLFRWQVSVVREVPRLTPQATPQGSPTPESGVSSLLPGAEVPEVDLISPAGETRSFYWY